MQCYFNTCQLSFLLQESLKALLKMRRKSKEKELEALLSGEQDPCSCYIEVSLTYFPLSQLSFIMLQLFSASYIPIFLNCQLIVCRSCIPP